MRYWLRKVTMAGGTSSLFFRGTDSPEESQFWANLPTTVWSNWHRVSPDTYEKREAIMKSAREIAEAEYLMFRFEKK